MSRENNINYVEAIINEHDLSLHDCLATMKFKSIWMQDWLCVEKFAHFFHKTE